MQKYIIHIKLLLENDIIKFVYVYVVNKIKTSFFYLKSFASVRYKAPYKLLSFLPLQLDSKKGTFQSSLKAVI